ncbi:hypothetical protein TNCV_5042751 [Trichonephila clavipes]|nr:hypothetical protein TNCV_5042751 [Trichonephila clavipes]
MRIGWAGHVIEMNEDRTTRKVFGAQPVGTREKGGPGLIWIDGLEGDLLVLRTGNGRALEGKGWPGGGFLRRTRPTRGCRATEEGRNDYLYREINISVNNSVDIIQESLAISRSHLFDSLRLSSLTGRPRVAIPAGNRFPSSLRGRTTTVSHLVADHFVASGTRIFVTTVRGSRFILEIDSGRLLICREKRTRYNPANIVEKYSYRSSRIVVWAGISLEGAYRSVPTCVPWRNSDQCEELGRDP